MRVRIITVCLLAALTACESGPRGRIMTDTDQDYVGDRRAGAAVYDQLIASTVERLLRLDSAKRSALGDKLKVACLEIDNKSGEELGDWTDQLFELIDTSINRSERYENISLRFVREALRETRLRSEQLFIPRHRRAFVELLEQQGLPVEALLFPKLTRGTTDGDGVTQRNYMLTLELVDVQTGRTEKVSDRIRKEYQR